MRCDIIIPIWNQLEFTRSCIESIINNTHSPHRLILIDNESEPETKNYLENFKDSKKTETILIRNDKNLGFVKAVNQGLKISDAPYVCILNNDTIPAEGWLEKMIDFASDHRDIGLVNPQCDGHLDTPIEAYARMLEKYKGEYMEMNQCHGFCMLVKRDLIERIGYLDEAYGIGGFDDTDYSMRAHLAGFRCAAIKDAYVYHRLHSSFNKSGDREGWVRRNQEIYYRKWGKHLRVGITVNLGKADSNAISHLIMLAYGLAREWSWVHIWINFRGDKNLVKKNINEVLISNNLPLHQNIRISFYNLPRFLFKLIIAAKFLERRRKRMRDKQFDASISFDDLSLSEDAGDWEKKGRELAASIKERRKLI